MAPTILEIARLYGLIGLLVAVPFLGWGIARVDPSARGAYAFRPLLLTGIVLLWPIVLWRWVGWSRGALAPTDAPHRRQAGATLLLLLLPVILLAAYGLRQPTGEGIPAIPLPAEAGSSAGDDG
ncbi:MAG: hypothetical protein AAGE18_14930 [Pseudomonadota bacterium]